MAIHSISSNNNMNIYNAIFGRSSGSSDTSTGINLGDYAMIRSGVYKKLIKSYYSEQKKADSTEKSDSEDSTNSLLSAKDSAKSLNDSLETLDKASLYAVSKDENGKDTYDTKAINSAVKDFVSSYNSYLKSAGDLKDASLFNRGVKAAKITSKNARLLSEVGITMGSDGKLKLDEEKLASADVSTLKSLFRGSGSYGDQIQENAKQSYRLANSAAYANNNASIYTFNGTYSTLGTANGIDQYL